MSFIDNLTNYSKEAFRLETLPIYKVNGEWENYIEYTKSGAIRQDKELLDFIELVGRKNAQHSRHIRVRSMQAINEYIKYEVHAGYLPQSRLGAEINFIQAAELQEVYLTAGIQLPIRDFWLFDRSALYYMEYSADGTFVRIDQETDESIVEKHVYLRDQIVRASFSLSRFLDTYLYD